MDYVTTFSSTKFELRSSNAVYEDEAVESPAKKARSCPA